MTVDIFTLLARYTVHANDEMGKILQNLSPEEWTRDMGGYFPSIQSLTAHIYGADQAWLGRIRGFRSFKALQNSLLDTSSAQGAPAVLTVQEYLTQRKALDQIFLAFTVELTEADVSADFTYTDRSGKQQKKNLGGLILHVFNHGTHHRGMIALYLDQMKRSNDFNGIMAVL
jgi:uncharacterized damage-inducible protein DinB